MNFRFQVKTCVAALLGLAVALAGLALVLQFAGLLFWQYGIALQKASWPKLPVGLLFTDHAKLATTALAPYLEYIPRLEWSWLANREDTSATHVVAVWLVNKVHIGLVPALLGVPILLGGGKFVLRQMRALAGARRYRADSRRRIDQYRRGSERLEPALDERPEARLEQVSVRAEARNDRVAFRKEPFIGGAEAPAGSDVEPPFAETDVELPQATALKSQKYY
ncbi:MAG TPA: hypothetical protein VKE95_19990 [Burkholderiales bacterium]|nr:hypothetical protein [Burkholderiales bacterium]